MYFQIVKLFKAAKHVKVVFIQTRFEQLTYGRFNQNSYSKQTCICVTLEIDKTRLLFEDQLYKKEISILNLSLDEQPIGILY